MSPFPLDVDLFVYVICLDWQFRILVSLFLKTFFWFFFSNVIPILSPKSCKGSEKALAQLLLYRKKVKTF